MKYTTGLYCRLSREDIEAGKHNIQSDSIENQKLLLEGYIKKHSDEFELYDIYIDDGITGMTYDRAAFNRMMQAVYDKKINCIIVKDLSRIGREQVETLNLIRKEFILHNVRFIALTDDYDSLNPSKSDGLSTSVKLLLNDYYCADISKKVRAAQRAKMEHGDFIGSHACYGYVKSKENKNKLVIDEEAAQVVSRIFSMYREGKVKVSIARALNADGIPNPTIYKQQVLHMNFINSNKLKSTNYWTYSTIHKILSNRIYAGDMVQHKSEIKAYNIHKKINVDKNNWCIIENTHEPIIPKEEFEEVQKMLSVKRRQLNLDENLSKYTGLFFCRECGRRMNKFLSKPRKDGSRYITFKCSTYSALGKELCTIHSIREDELDSIVLAEVKNAVKYALDAEACEYIKEKGFQKMTQKENKRLDSMDKKLDDCKSKRKNMLNHLAEGIITSEDFKLFDTENKAEISKIQAGIKELEEKLKNETKRIDDFNNWLNTLLEYKDIKEVTREVLVNLVGKIYISEKGDEKEIEIQFKFKNPME